MLKQIWNWLFFPATEAEATSIERERAWPYGRSPMVDALRPDAEHYRNEIIALEAAVATAVRKHQRVKHLRAMLRRATAELLAAR